MIAELVAGIGFGLAVLNGGVAYLLFRQYVSLEVAGIVAESITEDDGVIQVGLVVLAGVSMDHLSHLSGLVNRIQGYGGSPWSWFIQVCNFRFRSAESNWEDGVVYYIPIPSPVYSS
jgi:hypothetical protein